MNNISVQSCWGATIVTAVDSAGTEHRFWFDETEQGRVVLCAQITYIKETDYRDYVPRHEWSVPNVVQDALIAHGLDAETIYDTRGLVVSSSS